MNLYEIDAAILALADENGEITDFDALDALMMERDAKIEGIGCWIKNLTAEAKAIRDEEKALAERRQRAEAKAERLKEYLTRVLNGQKFSTARCQIGFRSSTATVVEDEAAAIRWAQENGHDECVSVKTSLVKSGLADLLKAGEEIPGAHMEVRQNISIK